MSSGVEEKSARLVLRPATAIGAGALVLAVLAPVTLTDSQTELLATYLIFGLVALGLDLIWGFTGVLSIGQFAFFGIGAYTIGIITTRVDEQSVWLLVAGAFVALFMAAIAAALIGYIFFSVELGLLFAIVTIAVAVILETVATSQSTLLGGSNGLLLPFWVVPSDLRAFFYIVALILLATLLLLSALVRSPSGKVLRAIRDSEERVRSLGFNTKARKVAAFALAGGLSGLAGSLYAILTGFVHPGLLGFALSFDSVVWVAVGGLGTLYGPVLGTIIVGFAKFYATSTWAEYWPLIIGLLFILVVVFLPGGLAAMASRLSRWRR